MGELRNCPACGKVFVRITRNLCPDCINKEEREFKEVRDFLRANPRHSVQEIAAETGVAEDRILKWMREGRLEIAALGGTGITCRKCGEPIKTGDLCTRCAKSLVSQFNAISRQATQKTPIDNKKKEPTPKGMVIVDRLRDS